MKKPINNKIKTYTFNEVFKKKPSEFKKGYEEESLRIELAQQIKIARTQKNLTQAAVAKKAGIQQSVVARLESGEHGVSVDTLGKVAHAMDKKVAIA